jgi:hypothetical protein
VVEGPTLLGVVPKDNKESGAMAAQRPVLRTHQFDGIAPLGRYAALLEPCLFIRL